MSLLEEIQNAAVDGSSDLGTLLRKCKVLASRLGSQPLENWILWESNGYPEEVEVPDYRVWSLQLKGHFAGPFGSGLNNAPIPMLCLPEEIKAQFAKYECRLSVASLEALLRASNKPEFRMDLPDLAPILGKTVYKGKNCIQAWAEFGSSSLVEVLNTVRNRILDFALAVWKIEPAAGELSGDAKTNLEPSQVTQIFNTTVFGGSANLIGAATQFLIAFNIVENDFSSLEKYLRDKGISNEDIAGLQQAIKNDPGQPDKGTFGQHVSSWIGAMMKKAADGSWAVGLTVAGNILARAIAQYYGLP